NADECPRDAERDDEDREHSESPTGPCEPLRQTRDARRGVPRDVRRADRRLAGTLVENRHSETRSRKGCTENDDGEERPRPPRGRSPDDDEERAEDDDSSRGDATPAVLGGEPRCSSTERLQHGCSLSARWHTGMIGGWQQAARAGPTRADAPVAPPVPPAAPGSAPTEG